eukprot:2741512-Alexandrium_andersonii.AAC.1
MPLAGQQAPAKGKGKEGAFAGRCWKCNEAGHASVDCPLKGKGSQLQAVEPAPSQPGSEPAPEN